MQGLLPSSHSLTVSHASVIISIVCKFRCEQLMIEQGRGGWIIGASSVAGKQGKPSNHKIRNINHHLLLRSALPQLIFVYKVRNPRTYPSSR